MASKSKLDLYCFKINFKKLEIEDNFVDNYCMN